MNTISDPSDNNVKKSYCSPQLIEYGSMAELTMTTTLGSNYDGAPTEPTLTTGPGV